MAKRIAVAGGDLVISSDDVCSCHNAVQRIRRRREAREQFPAVRLDAINGATFQTLLDSGAATARLAGDRHVAGSAGKLGHRARSKVSRLVPNPPSPDFSEFCGRAHFLRSQCVASNRVPELASKG